MIQAGDSRWRVSAERGETNILPCKQFARETQQPKIRIAQYPASHLVPAKRGYVNSRFVSRGDENIRHFPYPIQCTVRVLSHAKT
jgi:hypothetical protein